MYVSKFEFQPKNRCKKFLPRSGLFQGKVELAPAISLKGHLEDIYWVIKNSYSLQQAPLQYKFSGHFNVSWLCLKTSVVRNVRIRLNIIIYLNNIDNKQ